MTVRQAILAPGLVSSTRGRVRFLRHRSLLLAAVRRNKFPVARRRCARRLGYGAGFLRARLLLYLAARCSRLPLARRRCLKHIRHGADPAEGRSPQGGVLRAHLQSTQGHDRKARPCAGGVRGSADGRHVSGGSPLANRAGRRMHLRKAGACAGRAGNQRAAREPGSQCPVNPHGRLRSPPRRPAPWVRHCA